jgi:hypothetical protein
MLIGLQGINTEISPNNWRSGITDKLIWRWSAKEAENRRKRRGESGVPQADSDQV